MRHKYRGITFQPIGKCVGPLLKLIEEDKIDSHFIISNRIALDDVPESYEWFAKKESGYVKFVVNLTKIKK